GKPFVAINCSAVVPTLLESELFGHVRGAFTGADANKTGRLKLAEDGAVFFDEIGDMSLDLQAKLLRVLQVREFEPVGGVDRIPFRARVVSATHRNLKAMVADGTFREDLYYRLAVSTIHVPPLRERRNDIPLLANHLLGRIMRELQKELTGIEEQALHALQTHDWPGNVREFENVLTRAVLFARGDTITLEAIGAAMDRGPQAASRAERIKTLREAEREHVESALYATGWNITHTANLLEISPTTLRKKIADYRLSPP
ncbi:MAG: sigma-54-dependent Fis family transcriptional regulator, partial [Candidatus Hydrogenedentes bacterium]|nr:sigma-54-dependent Fis family transcriptional regulator [Candidatus Hydrogenedentota bacterium]